MAMATIVNMSTMVAIHLHLRQKASVTKSRWKSARIWPVSLLAQSPPDVAV